jgi:hypothetical protein
MGDAAFLSGNFTLALQQYEGPYRDEHDAGILVKLSDVYFRLGDLEHESFTREDLWNHWA